MRVDGWCWVQADSPELREKLQGKLTLAKQAKAAHLKEKAQHAGYKALVEKWDTDSDSSDGADDELDRAV